MALKHAEPAEIAHLGPGAGGLAGDKTRALVKSDRFEAVRLVVPAGATIPPHKVGGFLTLYCVEGHVALDLDKCVEMRAGNWLYLERGTPHNVRAVADSILLLTILFD